ncbi:cell envelope integrity protein CreD [Pseudodesulfovibrio sp. JC047]|uniref:cell envelope integrity protein CreD n=1 Tax=Pseudodesulfovibrio sp. JC047 TaxID=2683199 RepID=UPI0013D59490|nr:cell envelope integrity protein CreD [Pseudodesulfovibrio sp. JC047]NDV18667.1 cell envelope integrity protein CreD [Pseudodesulfovibrio sp. JC047]
MKGYLGKFCAITVLSLVCLIPLSMVEGVIYERDRLHQDVGVEIASQYAGYQRLTAPVLVAEYTLEETSTRIVRDALTKERKEETFTAKVLANRILVPEKTFVKGVLRPNTLQRGIFSIPVYTSKVQINEFFSKSDVPRVGQMVDGMRVVAVSLVMLMPLKEPGGISTPPLLQLNGRKMDVYPSHKNAVIKPWPTGFSTSVDPASIDEHPVISFSMTLDLHGSHELSFIPLGGEYAVDLQSIWPHPRFDGAYLPATREVTRTGFKAHWLVTEFANGAGLGSADILSWDRPSFGVELIDPVDIYTKSERAVKYGFLFVLLTLEFFFLFEMLRGMRIHVAQYLFVGAALIIFYLLLISLSEHIGFVLAYLVASCTCVSLLTVYVRSMVKSMKVALGFGGAIAVLYGALYGILLSEQYALVLGSGLLFIILAGTMFLTRHVDWYSLEGAAEYTKLLRRKKTIE